MSINMYMPPNMRSAIEYMSIDFVNVREIRIRVGQPVLIVTNTEDVILKDVSGNEFVSDRKLMEDLFSAVNDYSIYAHADSIRQGFITVKGGHRIGFLGQAVIDNGAIKSINNISSINIRVSHQIKGVSNDIVEQLYENENIQNTLIISPPGYGKTTLLRDLIRNISNGFRGRRGVSVSVIDERSEIAASYKGVPENDLGMRSDVFDNAPKSLGMIVALRSMSPKVIAVDEIGSKEDSEAIRHISMCGCNVLATAHGRSKEELLHNPYIKGLIDEKIFRRFVVIEKGGTKYVYS